MAKSRRVSFEITEQQGNQLKAFCALNDISIKGYIVNLIKSDWIKLKEAGKEISPEIW